MKHIIIFLLFTFCISGFSQSQSEWQNFELKGKVKSAREISYEGIQKGKKIKKGKRTDCGLLIIGDLFISFNENGQLAEVIHYDSDDKILSHETIQHDSMGRKIKTIYFNGTQSYDYTYEYNSRNEMVKRISMDSTGNDVSTTTYSYDGQGNLIYTEYNGSQRGFPPYSITSEYDENGKETSYTWKGYINEKVVNQYDEKGLLVGLKRYSLSDSLKSQDIYKIDAYGNKIESFTYNSNGKIEIHQEFEYTYDASGNWIRKITIDKEMLPCIVERKIIYHK